MSKNKLDIKPSWSISVLICTYNDQENIHKCISSILSQTISDFEIIIDDCSTDNTPTIIKSFKDKRIHHYPNPRNLGIAASRNRCIRLAKGNILFFTDGDCIVAKDWIEKGLSTLTQEDCIAVEGETYYVDSQYQPTFSDRNIRCHIPGNYLTCNIVYKREVFETIGGFNTQFKRISDRDMGLRAKKIGKIPFSKDMRVFHQQSIMSPRTFVKQGQAIENRVLLYKLHNEKISYRKKLADNEKRFINGTLINPERLITIFIPPLILGSLFRHKFKSKRDYNLLPFIYPQIIYERICLWRKSAEQKVLFI